MIEENQIVYMLPIGNAARRSDVSLTKVRVGKVGRKWFEIHGEWGRFSIETLLKDGKGYLPDYKIYLSEQDYHDEKETREIVKKLQDIFGGYSDPKIPLDRLRKIISLADRQ